MFLSHSDEEVSEILRLDSATAKRTKEEMDRLVKKLRYNISHEGTSPST